MSVAAALGLHVGLGFGLGPAGPGEEVGAMAPTAPEARLVWLEEDGAPSAPQVVGSAVTSAAPPQAARPAVPRKAPRLRAPSIASVASATSAEGEAPSGDALGVAGPGGAGAGDLGVAGGAAGAAQSRASRGPVLAASDPCADLFPYAARSDSGTVAVELDVATNGQPLESHIVEEAPRGQGFALAAHYCVRRLRFSPALDAEGHAVASRSVVRLRFARRSTSPAVAL